MNLLDLIFPKDIYCVSCGRPLPLQEYGNSAFYTALCGDCADEIAWLCGRCCAKCGRPLANENPGVLCRECAAGAQHFFGRAYACALYSGRSASIVRDIKYRNKAWYADTLAVMMAARYLSFADPDTGELPEYDYIANVPMSPRKRAKRGFDQSALLAAGLARRIGIPYLNGAIRRTRETAVMSALSGDERRRNLEGAFASGYDMIAERPRILLVDDVYTTGSSVDACAAVLLAAGARGVDVFVFAIGADIRAAADRPAVVESPGQLRAKGPT